MTRTKRITVRKTENGFYRITSRPGISYRRHEDAFNTAWDDCRRQGADLYAMTPDGRRVLSLNARAIRAYVKSK